MTANAPQIAFGDVSLRDNMLHIGNNTYAVKAVTGLNIWEENPPKRETTRKWLIVAIGSAVFTWFMYANSLGVHPSEAPGWAIIAVLFFYLGAGFTALAALIALFLALKSAATRPFRADNPKSRLTISFANGGSHTLAGKIDDLIPLKDAIAGAMAAH